jgi:integrase
MMARKTAIHVQLMNEHDCVREWLENRPAQTQTSYGVFLSNFCQFAKITPEQFQNTERKQARDLAWNFIKTLNNSPSMMSVSMTALKSFYRHKDGEILPFDCSRGGKHSFNNHRRKRLATEHIPTPSEIYDIVDEAGNLRNKTIILVLFQSGIRANALTRLTYGMVRYQLREGRIPLHLRITDEVDTKLRGYRLDFYDTFIGKEAFEMLARYCNVAHRNSADDTPLFPGFRGNRFITRAAVWRMFRKTLEKAGFNKETIHLHLLSAR